MYTDYNSQIFTHNFIGFLVFYHLKRERVDRIQTLTYAILHSIVLIIFSNKLYAYRRKSINFLSSQNLSNEINIYFFIFLFSSF